MLTQQLVYEGVCVSVAIWPRSAPRMSTAIERGTNTMAPRGWEPLPSAVRGGLVAHRCRPGSYPATGAAPREPRLLTRVCFTTRGEPSFVQGRPCSPVYNLHVHAVHARPCSPLIHKHDTAPPFRREMQSPPRVLFVYIAFHGGGAAEPPPPWSRRPPSDTIMI